MKKYLVAAFAAGSLALAAGCGGGTAAVHTPRPVLTTKAEKAAAHKAETAFLGCVQKHGLTSMLSHDGRNTIAGCMGFTGKTKANLVTCIDNSVLNVGSLFTRADRTRLKAEVVACGTAAELARQP